MNFFKTLLANILGFFIALFIIFTVLAMIAVSVASKAFSEDEVMLSSKSILELDLSANIIDYAPDSDNPIKKYLKVDKKIMGLNSILNAIERAKSDDLIEGISIKSPVVSGGISSIKAIRDKIIDFKSSGKFVYAYNDMYSQNSYYLSSVADSVFVNPIGGVDLKGLSAEILYFKDFQKKYGVKMEVIRHGKYKSAVEPFLESEMSEANREQTSSFLNSLWSTYTEDISKSRGISVEKLNSIADNSLGRTAELSENNRLVDAVIYEDVYKDKLVNTTELEKLNFISIDDYLYLPVMIPSFNNSKIAVIYAQGDIIYGEGNRRKIGQELMNKAIRNAANDDDVKAIVLRVNSPGGSALASDLILRELNLAKKKKPLVVSMGNYAASGGYYISCYADRIFAEPTTITGSIGVFGAIPNVYELSNTMGINAEQVSTNKSSSYSAFEPLSKGFYDVTKEGVEHIYKTFVNHVAKGRKMTFEQVNEVAQGRVWSGKEAVSKGLVDELGGIDKAVNYAAKLASVDAYDVINLPEYEENFKDMLKVSFPFMKVDKEAILKEALGDESYKLLKTVKDMKSIKGIQVRMPYNITIK